MTMIDVMSTLGLDSVWTVASDGEREEPEYVVVMKLPL